MLEFTMLVFTDASHSTKPRMSGLGVVIINEGKEQTFGTYTQYCKDNNVAEIAAIKLACEYIEKNKLPHKTITIVSDSECALNRISRGFQSEDSFEAECIDYIRDFAFRHGKVKFMQIKGHVHDGTKLAFYNNEADIAAGEYRKMGLELEQTKMSKKKKKRFIVSAYQSWKNQRK